MDLQPEYYSNNNKQLKQAHHNNAKNSLSYQEISLQQNINNKDSINTSVQDEISKVIINPSQYNDGINISYNHIDSNKTKVINKINKRKHKHKQATHAILKHQQILETLRNITKNIKSQLKTINNNQKIKNINKLQLINGDKQPEIKQVQTNQQTLIINEDKQLYSVNITQTDNVTTLKQQQQQQLIKPSQQQLQSHQIQTQPINQQTHTKLANNPTQKITLYSKYNNRLQSYPIYDENILTDKKQLRQMTIQRQMDNDIESQDQQIQMGVSYLYYQLVSSCKKNTSFIKMASLMKSNNNKAKVVRSQLSRMESVKQRLVFN